MCCGRADEGTWGVPDAVQCPAWVRDEGRVGQRRKKRVWSTCLVVWEAVRVPKDTPNAGAEPLPQWTTQLAMGWGPSLGFCVPHGSNASASHERWGGGGRDQRGIAVGHPPWMDPPGTSPRSGKRQDGMAPVRHGETGTPLGWLVLDCERMLTMRRGVNIHVESVTPEFYQSAQPHACMTLGARTVRSARAVPLASPVQPRARCTSHAGG